MTNKLTTYLLIFLLALSPVGAMSLGSKSAQNLKDLNILGIKNKENLMTVFDNTAKNGVIISQKSTNADGITITKSITVSNKGALKVSFFIQRII